MKYLAPIVLLAVVMIPTVIFAQDAAPAELVTCKDGGDCDFCDLVTMVQLISIWLGVIIGFIAVLLIAYAGFRMTASRGDINAVTQARQMIGNVVIGLFITILAVTIVDAIIQVATGKDFGVWNKPVNCGQSYTTRGGLID